MAEDEWVTVSARSVMEARRPGSTPDDFEVKSAAAPRIAGAPGTNDAGKTEEGRAPPDG